MKRLLEDQRFNSKISVKDSIKGESYWQCKVTNNQLIQKCEENIMILMKGNGFLVKISTDS